MSAVDKISRNSSPAVADSSVLPARDQGAGDAEPDRVMTGPANAGTGVPRVESPLIGALGGKAPGTRPTTWVGPVLSPRDLEEATESRLLDEAGFEARILPYRSFDARKRPVLLVHGIDGAGGHLRDLADGFVAKGRQVFFVLYDDRGTLTHESGHAVARALVRLRDEHYAKGASLDIVAHSMGGVVARAALNTLQDPSWMGDDSGVERAPRAGFGPIRLRTVDTPWDGGAHEPKWLGILAPVTKFFFWLFGWLGAFEMRGSSDMFDRLHETSLAGVEFQNIAARQASADGIRSVDDLNDQELLALGHFILEGRPPRDLRTRNFARSWADDSRFLDLRAALEQAWLQSPTSSQRARALRRVHDEIMPSVVGSHTGVLASGSLAHRLIRELD